MHADPADGDAWVDPASVQTLAELARALNLLRGTRSYGRLDKAGRPPGLARSTLSNLLNGKSIPTRETMATFLTACGLSQDGQQPWLAAWERVATADLRRPPAAVRVREARPRLLGVHASIQVRALTGTCRCTYPVIWTPTCAPRSPPPNGRAGWCCL